MANLPGPVNFHRPWGADPRVAVTSQVAALSLALLAGLPPPTNYDQPNPRIAARAIQEPGVQARALFNPPVYPVFPPDLPNPQIARRLLPEVGEQGLALGYAVFNPALPGDQPNPLRPRPPAHEAGPQSFSLIHPPPYPAFPPDLPNPLRPRPPAHEAGPQSLALNYAVFNPEFPVDQPNPLIKGRLLPEVGRQSLALALPAPFVPPDLPNPRGYVQPVKDWAFSVNLSLLGQDQFYGSPGQGPNFDFPNPRIAGRAIQEPGFRWPSLGPNPFYQTDHPNPIPPKRILSTFEPGARTANIVPASALPPRLLDWPNPIPYRIGVSLKTHIDPLKINLIGKDVFPIRPGAGPEFGFPNPLIKGREWPPVGHHNPNLNPPPIVPFSFALIPTIQHTGQLQLQLNTLFQALINLIPGAGPVLPTATPATEGRIFTLTPSQQVYQQQNGVWVRLI